MGAISGRSLATEKCAVYDAGRHPCAEIPLRHMRRSPKTHARGTRSGTPRLTCTQKPQADDQYRDFQHCRRRANGGDLLIRGGVTLDDLNDARVLAQELRAWTARAEDAVEVTRSHRVQVHVRRDRDV